MVREREACSTYGAHTGVYCFQQAKRVISPDLSYVYMTLQMKTLKWLAVTGQQRRMVLRAWVMGVACVICLRFGTYDRARRVMARMAGRQCGLSVSEAAWAAMAGAGRAPGAKCLATALVGEALLRASGHEPELCIGVALEGGFRAHAWVESGGQAVVGTPQDGEYERLVPAGAATA
jgi:hypothetical protein